MPVSLVDQITCVDRELRMREKVYPRWVKAHKLTQKLADLELARMHAVLVSLVGLYVSCSVVEPVSVAEWERVASIGAVHMDSATLTKMMGVA